MRSQFWLSKIIFLCRINRCLSFRIQINIWQLNTLVTYIYTYIQTLIQHVCLHFRFLLIFFCGIVMFTHKNSELSAISHIRVRRIDVGGYGCSISRANITYMYCTFIIKLNFQLNQCILYFITLFPSNEVM